MFRRKGPTSLAFPKAKAIDWLSWLAEKMREHAQSVFLVEGLQPSWLGTRARRGAYGTIVALSLWLIFELIFGLIFGLIVMHNVGRGLIVGLGVGLAFGLCDW